MTSIDNGQFQDLSASELTSVDGGLLQAVVGFFLAWSWEKALDGLDDGSPSLADIAGYK
jgi:hypothetical protein